MVSVLAWRRRPSRRCATEIAATVGPIRVANLLCPGNTVVSGAVAACEAVEKQVEAKGGRTIRLTVAGAFHTQFMKPADEAPAAALAGSDDPFTVQVRWSGRMSTPNRTPTPMRFAAC